MAGWQVWTELDSRKCKRTKDAKDWLLVAINDAGGKLAEFYLRVLWQASKDAGDDWIGLTDDFRILRWTPSVGQKIVRS
jgi:hypothetical protein